ECNSCGRYEIIVCTIPASAWTWLVRPRKASAVTMGGAGFDAGDGNPGPVCARPPASQSLRHRVELVRMSGDSGLGVGGLMLEWGSPGEEGVVPLGWGVADLTCVRSAVRQLGSSVQPVGQLRRVGHVGGPDVRKCDDLTARSTSIISEAKV
ncbi:hypothetical protein BHM03_00007719, partial [Ensete ventricosum]